MRTVKIKSVYEAVVRLRGMDPAQAYNTAAQMATIAELINDRVLEGWENDFWPEIMAVEEREYRPTWDSGVNYSAADEVYYDGAYYVSRQGSNVGKQPDTEAAWWEAVGDDFIRSIDFDQDGETEIGAVDVQNCVFDKDPRLYRFAGKVEDVWLNGGQIIVGADEAPLQPWVRFRPVCPAFSLTAWSAATDYAIGDLCYLASTGETYKALVANTNKDPYSQTTDWEPVGFPQFLVTYVKHAVAADLTQEDEGRYKEQARAAAELERLADVLIEAQGEGRRAVFGRLKGK